MHKTFVFLSSLLATTVCFAEETTLQQNLSESEQRIQELEKKLTEEINRNNTIRAKMAGKDVSIPEAPKAEPTNISDLTKKLKALEEDVARLKAAKPDSIKLDGARTESEAIAQKEAQAHAPQLDVSSPLIAQYNMASASYAKGELDVAREAFIQIVKNQDVPATDVCIMKSWQHLGEIHQKQKNFRLSEEAYKEALKRPLPLPSAIECRLGLTETLIALGETKDACDHVAALEKMEKDHLNPQQKTRLKLLAAQCKPKTETKHEATVTTTVAAHSMVLTPAAGSAAVPQDMLTPPAASPAVHP